MAAPGPYRLFFTGNSGFDAGIGWDRNGEKKASTIGEREGVGRVEGDRRERNTGKSGICFGGGTKERFTKKR